MSWIGRMWRRATRRPRERAPRRRLDPPAPLAGAADADLAEARAALRVWASRTAEQVGSRAPSGVDPALGARLARASEAAARRIEAIEDSLRAGRRSTDALRAALAAEIAELAAGVERRSLEPRVLH